MGDWHKGGYLDSAMYETPTSPEEDLRVERIGRKGFRYLSIAFFVLLSFGTKAILNYSGKPQKTGRELAWYEQRENKIDYRWVQTTRDFHVRIGASNEQTERAVKIVHTPDEIKRSLEFKRFLEENEWANERFSLETEQRRY